MSIEDISMKINGTNISLGNVTEKQLLEVIKVLNKDNQSKEDESAIQKSVPASFNKNKGRNKRSRIRASIDNYQFENTPQAISDDFDIELALNSEILLKSFDNGKCLPLKSKQLKARREIIWIFADNGNKSLEASDVCKPLRDSMSLSRAAAANYISQCVRLGVLAKSNLQNHTTYFLSSWFIEQVAKEGRGER